MTDTTAPAVHFYYWEDCELACSSPGVDTSSDDVETEDVTKVTCPDCLTHINAMAKFLVDGTVRLTTQEARWIAETISWNVDIETVRLDNGDVDRAKFLTAFADAILGKPRD